MSSYNSFSKGEKVLVIGTQPGIQGMLELLGKECTIETVGTEKSYTLEEDNNKYIWNEEYLKPIGIPAGTKVYVLNNFYDMRFEDDPSLDPSMDDYEGSILTIKEKLNHPHWYKVNENYWTWDDRWLSLTKPVEFLIDEDDLMNVIGD